MSTVGKVLVIAQVAFSLLLMAFAAGVSSMQTNYKAKEATARASLQKSQDEVKKLTEKVAADSTEHAAQEKKLTAERDTAQGEAAAAKDKIKQSESQLAQARTELANIRAEANIAGQEARARREEAVGLREINDQLHKSRDDVLAANRQQNDRIVNLEQDARTMTEKHNQLLNNYATLQKFIRIKGFEADPKELAGLTEPPPVVQGIVLSARKGGRNRVELVEIDLGSDMGLAKGNEL